MTKRAFRFLLPALLLSCSTQWAASTPTQILCFGDSTTALRPGQVEQVYSVRLEKALQAQRLNVKVANEGVPGSHTGKLIDNGRHQVAHAQDRLQERILDQHPTWVIMQFGINDSYADEGGAGGKSRIPLPAYRKNMTYLIETILKADSQVLLMTPNPFGASLEKFRHDCLQRYVETAREVGKEAGVPVLDIYQLFQEKAKAQGVSVDHFLLDGVHPNDEGHQLITEALIKKLIPLLVKEGKSN